MSIYTVNLLTAALLGGAYEVKRLQ